MYHNQIWSIKSIFFMTQGAKATEITNHNDLYMYLCTFFKSSSFAFRTQGDLPLLIKPCTRTLVFLDALTCRTKGSTSCCQPAPGRNDSLIDWLIDWLIELLIFVLLMSSREWKKITYCHLSMKQRGSWGLIDRKNWFGQSFCLISG